MKELCVHKCAFLQCRLGSQCAHNNKREFSQLCVYACACGMCVCMCVHVCVMSVMLKWVGPKLVRPCFLNLAAKCNHSLAGEDSWSCHMSMQL